MDVAIMMKRAGEVVAHLEAISNPTDFGDDDTAKRAILEVATKVYDARITQQATLALLKTSIDNIGKVL